MNIAEKGGIEHDDGRTEKQQYARLHNHIMANILAGDLQDCMDACPKGKRTHQNMKVAAGLLWASCTDHLTPYRGICIP